MQTHCQLDKNTTHERINQHTIKPPKTNLNDCMSHAKLRTNIYSNPEPGCLGQIQRLKDGNYKYIIFL